MNPADARSVDILHTLGLTEDMVRNHVFRPHHVTTATLGIELREAGNDADEMAEAAPPSGLFYRLDVDGLARDLHDVLSGCLSGYSLQLRRYSRTLIDQQWNWSRTPPDGGVPWTADAQMHVASVSKLVTAMAMTKLLYSRNISADARIWPWLPKYWQQGPGVERLTFRHLLTHRSGLVLADGAGPSDFNSPLCAPDTGFINKVLEAIEDNIQSTLLSFVIAAGSALAAVGLYRRARATRRPA